MQKQKKQKIRTPDSHIRLLYTIYIHTNAAVFHPRVLCLPVSSCCAFLGLERRFWQSLSSWLSVRLWCTAFLEAGSTCAAAPEPTRRTGRERNFLFARVGACRNPTPARPAQRVRVGI